MRGDPEHDRALRLFASGGAAGDGGQHPSDDRAQRRRHGTPQALAGLGPLGRQAGRRRLGIGRVGRQAQPFDDRQHQLRVGAPGRRGELDLVRPAVAVLGEEHVEAVEEVDDVDGLRSRCGGGAKALEQPVDALVEHLGERSAVPDQSDPAATCRSPDRPSRSPRSRTWPSPATRARPVRRAPPDVRPGPPGCPRRSRLRAGLAAAPPASARTRPPGPRPPRRSGAPGSTPPTLPSRPGWRRGRARLAGTCGSLPERPGPSSPGCDRPDHGRTVALPRPRTSAGRRRRRACQVCGRRRPVRTTG